MHILHSTTVWCNRINYYCRSASLQIEQLVVTGIYVSLCCYVHCCFVLEHIFSLEIKTSHIIYPCMCFFQVWITSEGFNVFFHLNMFLPFAEYSAEARLHRELEENRTKLSQRKWTLCCETARVNPSSAAKFYSFPQWEGKKRPH